MAWVEGKTTKALGAETYERFLDLWNSYNLWFKGNECNLEYKIEAPRAFARALERYGLRKGIKRIRKKQWRVYEGISLME